MVEELVLEEIQDDSLVFESEAQLAVLEMLGEVFCDPSELDVVCDEALDSTDHDERSRERGRLDLKATRLSRVPILCSIVSISGSEL